MVVAKLAVVATPCWAPCGESEMVVAELEVAATAAKRKAMVAILFIVYLDFLGWAFRSVNLVL